MLIQAVDITKYYAATPILEQVTMHINEGEKIGLVGVNGAGKSTFMRILAGEEAYDSGQIHRQKNLQIGYLAQNGGLESDNTLYDELRIVFAKQLEMEEEMRQLEAEMADADDERLSQVMSRYADISERFREERGYEIEARIRGMLSGMGFAEFSEQTRVHSLSGGQKTRLALAKLLLQEPHLLMLDEPTNYLDIATLSWLEDYLRSYSGALLIISHDRYFLDAVVHSILEIDRTKMTRYTGNYSRFVELKAAEYETKLKHYEKQQEEIAKLEDFVQRNLARASTSNRAKSRRKVLERMDRLDRPAGEQKRTSFSFEIDRSTGQDVLQASDLSFAYDTEPVFNNIHLQLSRGDSVALVGPNGVGKSTLLKVLIGEGKPATGTVQWGSNVKLGYYDQEHEGLNPNHTVLQEVWNEYPHLDEVRIRTVLGGFLFSGEAVEKKIASLSGGEKARVSLAKLMLKHANVLILDEPTNHLDLYSKEALEAALLDYEGTLLFVSHDRYFLNKMATRVLEMNHDGIEYFLGNYDDYMEKKRELVELAELSEEENPSKDSLSAPNETSKPGQLDEASHNESTANTGMLSYEEKKKADREERARKRKLKQLESDIAHLEQRIELHEQQLGDPDIAHDYVKLQELNDQMQQDHAELETLYKEWESIVESLNEL